MKLFTFFLDDYQTIKASSRKPFSSFEDIRVMKDGTPVLYEVMVEDDCRFVLTLSEEFDYDHYYYIMVKEERYDLELRMITHTERFEQDFLPDLDTLGSFYTKEYTRFRVWAPLAGYVNLILQDERYPMERKEKGVFEVTMWGDLERKEYRYEIERYHQCTKIIDPFAYSSGPNASFSYVLDPSYFIQERYPLSDKLESYTDAIIYEISVRDFSKDISFTGKHHGILKALEEDNLTLEGRSIGLGYLKELGITHLQLMPIFDFGSVNEVVFDRYNWGYDPVQYNVVDGIYASNIYDPYTRVNDLISVVNTMHKNNIRINLDVVFNHVYHVDDFALAQALPYYFYRYTGDLRLSNGSFCGNELRSESAFMRAYILAMCKRYITLFDIDGLRFDLMGLIDLKTMMEVKDMVHRLKEDFMVYGEGWDMPSVLPTHLYSSINNASFLKRVAFFNPHFRDVIKGPTSLDQKGERGYVLGNLDYIEEVKNVLSGDTTNGFFKNPDQSINYIECHDNMTFYDKMAFANREENDELYKKRAKLAIGITLLAQGIPFLHSGQEFLRTKEGYDNSYNLSDEINKLDWYRRNRYEDVVNYTKDMITIRKRYPSLRKKDTPSILKDVHFENYYEVLVYNVDDLKILINPCPFHHLYNLNEQYRMIYNENGFDDVHLSKCVGVAPYSIVILEKIFSDFS